jgi:hypothetical protein
MRYNASFHPEWGYLAPAPSFIRTVRIVFIATAVGAAVGAGVGFSWIGHGAESSVAARTLVRPMKAAPTPANTPAQVPNEPRASPTTGAKEGIAALSEVPAATDEPATGVTAAPATTTNQTAVKAPIKKRATTKPNVTRRYASRHESLGLVPGEYSRRRSTDEYRVSGARGGYYRESRHWGGYYGDGGGGPYQDW